MSNITMILLVLLVVGFIGIWTKYGRALFDVAAFIILLFLLVGRLS